MRRGGARRGAARRGVPDMRAESESPDFAIVGRKKRGSNIVKTIAESPRRDGSLVLKGKSNLGFDAEARLLRRYLLLIFLLRAYWDSARGISQVNALKTTLPKKHFSQKGGQLNAQAV